MAHLSVSILTSAAQTPSAISSSETVMLVVGNPRSLPRWSPCSTMPSMTVIVRSGRLGECALQDEVEPGDAVGEPADLGRYRPAVGVVLVVDGQSAPGGDGSVGVHQPGVAGVVGDEELVCGL